MPAHGTILLGEVARHLAAVHISCSFCRLIEADDRLALAQAGRYAARTMRLAILAALLSITLGARVRAQQATIIIAGTGLYSCGRWANDRRNNTLTAYGEGQWILGYIVGATAYSSSPIEPLDGIDMDGVWAWIDNYCATHPVDKIANAASAYIRAYPNGKQ